MSPHGEYGDRLAALDARLSRLLDAVRRARHDIEHHRERGNRGHGSRDGTRREHGDRQHGDRQHDDRERSRRDRGGDGEHAGQHRRGTGEQR